MDGDGAEAGRVDTGLRHLELLVTTTRAPATEFAGAIGRLRLVVFSDNAPPPVVAAVLEFVTSLQCPRCSAWVLRPNPESIVRRQASLIKSSAELVLVHLGETRKIKLKLWSARPCPSPRVGGSTSRSTRLLAAQSQLRMKAGAQRS